MQGLVLMNKEAIIAQSKAAYGQWAKQWREQAVYHSKHEMKPMSDFENIGIGRAVLAIANGYTLEENIEIIKKNQHKVDIICCDKTLGHLLDNGITPTYCVVCDANVNYEKYMEPWKDQLQGTVMFINACANPKWSDNGNWKDIYFFINKDVLDSHKEFSELSGCNNFIAAGTNVSNAMIILLTQSDEAGSRNFFGYDKILLIGYDYSWRYGGKYYAFDKDGGGKANYMRHNYFVTYDGSYAYTSGNLAFSAQWLETYVRAFNLPVIQCTKKTALSGLKFGDLEKQMNYLYKPEDSKSVIEKVKELRMINSRKIELEKFLKTTHKAHWNSFQSTV
jgi:hypothetical protein